MHKVCRLSMVAGGVAALLGLSLTAAGSAIAAPAAPARSMLVIINPNSGAIEAETAVSSATPQITEQNICNVGWACWETGNFLYANIGFHGTAGTKTGDWPNRYAFSTGNYIGSFKYSYAGRTHSEGPFPSHTTAQFGGILVTGTSATIN